MHIPTLVKHSHKVVEVVDINPESSHFINYYYPGARVIKKIEEISSNVDVALVSTPTGLHYGQVSKLLNMGLNVFCEKPLSNSGTEARKLMSLAVKRGLVLQTGYYRNYHSTVGYITKLIHSNTYGQVVSCNVFSGGIENSSSLPASMYDKGISGGGVLVDMGVHLIDRLLTWFPTLSLVWYADDNLGGIEANAVAKFTTAKYGSQIPVKMQLSRTIPLGYYSDVNFAEVRIRIYHNDGNNIYISPREDIANSLSLSGEKVSIASPKQTLDYFNDQWVDFMLSIDNIKNFNSNNLERSVQVSNIVQQCYESRNNLEMKWEQLFNDKI